MKKIVAFLLSINLILLTSCNLKNTTTSLNGVTSKFKELDKYIFEVDEYTSLDYDFADEFYGQDNDNWNEEGGCSAISKMVDGHRLVGRNMDLFISNRCAYIIRTNTGKHKTIGLAYTYMDCSPNYDDISKNGFSEEFYKILPFLCDDVFNDAGLHIELNMRHGEFWPNSEDKYSCPGTNPDADRRVYMFELPRYIGENCASVDEAKEYINTIDIYSRDRYWSYSFLISDDKGKSSVLEFNKDKVYWVDEDKINTYDWLNSYDTKAIAQTNFYINEASWLTQDTKVGEGRFIELQKGIENVNSRSDMYDLMRKIQYSNFYLGYDECSKNCFNPLSEIIGEVGYLTYDYVHDPEHLEEIKQYLDRQSEEFKSKTRQEKQDEDIYWESTFTEVIDTTTKEMFVRFFENEEKLYLINFDETIKLDSIADWK